MPTQVKTPQIDSNITGAWTSYTPAWTASSSNPAIGNGTLLNGYLMNKCQSIKLNQVTK